MKTANTKRAEKATQPTRHHYVNGMMRTNEVTGLLKITRQGLWKMMQTGRYPRPDLYMGRHPRWYVVTHNAWVSERELAN